MPWRVRKVPVKGPKDWAIQKKEGSSWKIVGRSTSQKLAKESVAARRASKRSKND